MEDSRKDVDNDASLLQFLVTGQRSKERLHLTFKFGISENSSTLYLEGILELLRTHMLILQKGEKAVPSLE